MAVTHGEANTRGAAFQNLHFARKQTRPIPFQPATGVYLPRYYPMYQPYPIVHPIPNGGWYQPWAPRYPLFAPFKPKLEKPKEKKQFHRCDYHDCDHHVE